MAKPPARKPVKSLAKASDAPDKAGKVISVAHHIDSVNYNAAHAKRHIQEAQKHAQKVPNGGKRIAGVKAELTKLAAQKKRMS